MLSCRWVVKEVEGFSLCTVQERAVFCLTTQQWRALHSGWSGGGAGPDSCPPPSAGSVPLTVKPPDAVCANLLI